MNTEIYNFLIQNRFFKSYDESKEFYHVFFGVGYLQDFRITVDNERYLTLSVLWGKRNHGDFGQLYKPIIETRKISKVLDKLIEFNVPIGSIYGSIGYKSPTLKKTENVQPIYYF